MNTFAEGDLANAAIVWVIVLTTSLVIESVIVSIAYVLNKRQMKLAKEESDHSGNNQKDSKKMDMSVISTILQTLIPQEKEFALPGFLQLDANSDFKMKQLLAKGGSGTIHLADIISENMKKSTSDSQCIIKQLVVEDLITDEIRCAFFQEISMMWFFNNHPNFAKLYGFCFNPLLIAMKYYPLGSLSQFIFKTKDVKWNSHMISFFMADIAAGLEDMHRNNIVHNDIKPENILVDYDEGGNYKCVLTDLGISQILSPKTINIVKSFRIVKIQGASAPYAAPETFLKMRGTFPTSPLTAGTPSMHQTESELFLWKAADIYAFALSCYEMVSRRKSWKGIKVREEIEARVLAGDRPEFPDKLLTYALQDKFLELLMKLIIACWQQNPLDRPSMTMILEELKEGWKTYHIPLRNVKKKERGSFSSSKGTVNSAVTSSSSVSTNSASIKNQPVLPSVDEESYKNDPNAL